MPEDAPDDATVNESAPTDSEGAKGSEGEGTEEVRHDAAAELKEAVAETEAGSAGSGERTPEQGPPRTTPTLYEAQEATAAATPSEEAGKHVRAQFAEEREKEQESGSGTKGRHRSARELVNEGEAPLAPLPGRAEPADQDAGSPADAEETEES